MIVAWTLACVILMIATALATGHILLWEKTKSLPFSLFTLAAAHLEAKYGACAHLLVWTVIRRRYRDLEERSKAFRSVGGAVAIRRMIG